MSELKKISGVINTSRILSSTSGSVNTSHDYDGRATVEGSVRTRHWTTFRVNDTPCRYNGTPSLKDGDRVTVVGKGEGEINVWILYNETTKLRYTGRGGGGLMYLYGIISIISFNSSTPQLGVVFLLGALYWYKYKRDTKYATKLLFKN